jgi:hypothetical protein
MNFQKRLYKMLPFLLFVILAMFPGSAWAVQSHGAPEGLYVHQFAHIFYTAALCYLFWCIRHSVFKSKGWRYLQVFCLFMILWNVVAFTGHSLDGLVDSVNFNDDNGYLGTRLLGPFTNLKLWYYFTKLDHLFSIPALVFLYLGMKAIYRNTMEEKEV